MNVDAAFNSSSGQVGVGIVVRNSAGFLVCTAGLVANLASSAAVAEAKSILLGAQLAVKKGFFPLCLESDALNVVNMCKAISSSRCDIGNLIHDIVETCIGVVFVDISYTPRSSNFVAHSIAKWALGRFCFTVWESVFPPWLRKISDLDVSAFFCPGG
ncbi:hypothetical protein ACOSQ3_007045 [Xanthoceras sorbifolium]